MTPRLLRAYRQTIYAAAGVTFRIGRRSAATDAMLRRHSARVAILIGADNPFSRRMPPGWNDLARRRLRQRLRRCAWADATGTGTNWSENHILAFGPIPPLLKLAALMRQNGIVILRPGQPPLLRATSRPNWTRSQNSGTQGDERMLASARFPREPGFGSCLYMAPGIRGVE